MTDDEFADTEQRVRAALGRIAGTHQPRPALDAQVGDGLGRRPMQSPRRWTLVAASVVVVAAGLVALAVVRFTQEDSGRDPVTTAVVDTELERPATTDVEPPVTTVQSDSTDADGVRFPVDDFGRDASWVVAWADGFLAGTSMDLATGEASFRVRYSVDGEEWEPLDAVMPPGLRNPARVTAVGDRLILAGSLDGANSPTIGGGRVVRVASSTDLLSWSMQDFEVPLPVTESGDFAFSFVGLRDFAANADGWVFEVARIYSEDNISSALPVEVQQDVGRGGYVIRSDDAGVRFTTTVSNGDIPVGSTYTVTWEELGVSLEEVPYLTGEVPATETWAARWDGEPARADVDAPSGLTLASDDGFVRWDHDTWFSTSGLSWERRPPLDPTGVVQGAFEIDDGFVAVVGNQAGGTDLYRLNSVGADPEIVEVDGLPSPYVAVDSPSSRAAYPEHATLTAAATGGTALVVDADGYRLISEIAELTVIDLETGDIVFSEQFFGEPPAADTNFVRTNDGFAATDPVTGATIMEISQSDYQAAFDEQLSAAEPADATNQALVLLATRGGGEFLVAPLLTSDGAPATTADSPQLAANDTYVLARLGDTWVRYELPG